MSEALQCGLVLLAAGASRRMGRAKQLLPVRGVPLVRHAALAALAAPVAPVVVVLGAHADEVRPALAGLALHLVVNPDWAEGLGSSVRTGLAAVLALAPQVDAVMVALADQPGVTPAHLAALLARHRRWPGGIVATEGAGMAGPPVVFGAKWFARLGAVAGDTGARELLRSEAAAVARVALAGAADLDTPDDYTRFVGEEP